MVIPRQWGQRRIADGGYGLDGHAVLLQPEASTCQDLLVAARMQVGESAGELYFLAVHGDGSVGALADGLLRLRHIGIVHGQEPAHPRTFVFQVAARVGFRIGMHHVGLQRAEDVVQHVEKMHADVGGDTAGFLHIALPGLQIPVAAGRNVSQINFVLAVLFLRRDPIAQSHDRRVYAQLQDGVDPVAGVALDFLQAVDIPGVQH